MAILANNTQRVNESGSHLGSLDVVEILMMNSAGEVKDIRNLVGYTRITESLDNPTLILQLGIRDASNFFEEFQISGSEKISITLEQKFFQSSAELKHTRTTTLLFYVTEYPDYGRSKDNKSQIYTLSAVSYQAYVSPFKRISRSIKLPLVDEILKILITDLNLDPANIFISGEPNGTYRGVIPWTNPLDQAMRFLSKLADEKNSPYYLYQRIANNGSIHLDSLGQLNDLDVNPIYREFKLRNFQEASNTDLISAEVNALSSIISITSNLRLNRLDDATSGAYAATGNYIDIVNKDIRVRDYDYARDMNIQNTLSKKTTLPENYTLDINASNGDAKPLNKLPGAFTKFIFTNRFMNQGQKSLNDAYEKSAHVQNIYKQNFNICSHTIDVPGDLGLNPGKVISLMIPKAIDMEVYKSYTQKSNTDGIDHVLSGNYLIFGVEHFIQNGTYTCKLNLKKDAI